MSTVFTRQTPEGERDRATGYWVSLGRGGGCRQYFVIQKEQSRDWILELGPRVEMTVLYTSLLKNVVFLNWFVHTTAMWIPPNVAYIMLQPFIMMICAHVELGVRSQTNINSTDVVLYRSHPLWLAGIDTDLQSWGWRGSWPGCHGLIHWLHWQLSSRRTCLLPLGTCQCFSCIGFSCFQTSSIPVKHLKYKLCKKKCL